MTKVIGLVGYPRSGKDTLADALVSTGEWKKVAFADAMKDLFLTCRPAIDFDGDGYEISYMGSREDLERGKRVDPDVREALQEFGQGVRDIDPQFWVRAAHRTMMQHKANDYNIVVSDIRYPNEEQMVLRFPGTVIGVQRDGYGPVNDHESEVNTGKILERTKPMVYNDKDPQWMVDQVMEMLRP